MKIISGDDAWANVSRRNKFSRWDCASGSPGFSRTANGRLQQGAFVAEYEVGIQLTTSHKVFCIGSCFARNVERALRESGVDVRSGLIAGQTLATTDTFNLYNTESMLNELRWALDPGQKFDNDSFLPDHAGYFDPHTALSGSRSLERCRELRHNIISTTSKIKECDVLIITLGLVEAWFDKKFNCYLNIKPPRMLVDSESGRFELHVLDYSDSMRALEDMRVLIEGFASENIQIVLTVSPVPFQATFSPEDVVVSNMYSKSVLRCVAQDFASRYQFVHYIPVYDSIINSDPALAWESDRIHVRSNVVRMNIANFLAKTILDPKEKSNQCKAFVEARNSLISRNHPSDITNTPVDIPMDDMELPDFESANIDSLAFPCGLPVISSSSRMSDEYGPENLSFGEAIPWHSCRSPTFPQLIDIRHSTSLLCSRVWIQVQDRHPERGPTSFFLRAGDDGGNTEETQVIQFQWEHGGQWASFDLNFLKPWPFFQLVVLSNGSSEVLTIQRIWLQPRGWSGRVVRGSLPDSGQ